MDVVITAMGAVSAAGRGLASLEGALVGGMCALGPVRCLEGARGTPGGEAPLPGPGDAVDPLPRALALLDLAAAEALAARGDAPTLGDERTAVVLGTAQGALPLGEALHAGAPASPHHRAYLPGAGVERVQRAYALRGAGRTVGMACVSSAVAILHGVDLLRRGWADRVVAGGFEGLSELVWRGFSSLGLVSPEASRPFDEGRQGLSLGEAAAVVVLEREASARSRRVTPLAVVAGGAVRSEARHLAAPDPRGRALAEAIGAALHQAGVGPDALDYVNAHATGTLRGDPAEVAALRAALGPAAERVPTSSIKGITGHTLGAAGALEVVATTLALRGGFLPPTVGLRRPLDGLGWDLVPDAGRRPGRMRAALCTWSAFGGHVCALVLKRPEGP